MHKVIFVKDEDGLYTASPSATLGRPTSRASPSRRCARTCPTSFPLDRQLFEAWATARHVREVQIVNGLRQGGSRGPCRETISTVIVKEQRL